MHALRDWQRRVEAHDSGGLSDLRRDSIAGIAAVLIVMSWVILLVSIAYRGRVEGVWVAVLLSGGGVGIIGLRDKSFLAARIVLIVSSIAAVAIQKWLFRDSPAQFFYPVVVVACSLLVSRWSTFAVATLASLACLLVAGLQGAGWLDRDQVAVPIFLIYLTAFAAWLGSRQMHITFEWMQSTYTHANSLLDELRDERMQLARTVKALDEAYYRIARLNDALIEARSAAENARRLKSDFAAKISHELRTPLNLIIGFSETMANAPETYANVTWSPILRGDIEQIYRSSRHLAELIDDILDLSALEVRQLGLIVEDIDIQTVIEEALAVVYDLFRARHLYLKVDAPPGLPRLRIDATRIRQVLLNLLANAVRFTRVGGVTISARLIDGNLQVAMADTGAGIAPQDVAKVFEEFGQIEDTASRKHEGTGLGVPLSKRLVELHGGRMWLESEPGVGTTFYFSLPVDAGSPHLPSNGDREQYYMRPGERTPTYRKALLLAEPDPVLFRTIRRHLSAYDLIGVNEWEALPGLVDRYQPVALVVNTSDQPAFVFAREWAAAAMPGLPVISLSLPGGLSRARALGIEGYLIKPILREPLLEAIADLHRPVHTILIVDDDPKLADLLGRMLQSSGKDHRLLKAFGGREALSMLGQQSVDLVLLDMVMPDLGGLEVLQVMKQDPALAKVPVMVISAQPPTVGGPEEGLFLQVVRSEATSMAQVLSCLEALVEKLPRQEPAGLVREERPVSPKALTDRPAS